RSMTPAERNNPKILNGSRRSRIARGSGTTVTEVNQLIQRFEAAQTMMKQMNRREGGKPGMPGMPRAPGMVFGKKSRGRYPPKTKKRKKGRSGNPAKRAQQEREAAMREAQGGAAPGSAFGIGETAPTEKDVEIPPGLDKFLR